MKYLKMLGLAALAALAVTAFVGASSASATILCKVKPTKTAKGWTCPIAQVWGVGKKLGGKMPAGKKMKMKTTTSETLDECSASAFEGEIVSPEGGESATVHEKLSSLTFGECTSTADTLVNGELEIHDISSEEGNGTVIAKSLSVTLIAFGTSCTYGAGESTDIGKLVGGEPATLSVNAVLNKTAGSFLCPSDIRWEVEYQITQPEKLWTADYAD